MPTSITPRLEGGIAHGIRGLHTSLRDVHASRAKAFSNNSNNNKKARALRPLVPVHGPICWRRKESTRKVEIVEEFAEPTPIDPEEWESQPRHIKRQYDRAPQPHRPLKGGSSRQVVGQRLRTVLANGIELRDLMDPDDGRRLLGLDLEGDEQTKKRSRQRLEFAAAATATIGKYAGSTVSDQYVKAGDLSNELDGYMEEHRKAAGDLEEPKPVPNIATPGLETKKSEKVRKTAKAEALPWKEMSDFERRLARNPYARQLQSAVRLDTLCNTRLPKDFMTSFNVKMHKKTGQPTMVPITDPMHEFERRYTHRGNPLSLRAAEPHLRYNFPEPRSFQGHHTFRGLLRDAHKRDIENPYGLRRVERTWSDQEPSDSERESIDTTSSDAHVLPSGVERQGVDAVNSAAYVLCAPPLLYAMNKLPGRWKIFLHRRWLEHLGFNVIKDFTFRDDMHEHTLKFMRRRASRFLASLEHTGQPVLSPFNRQAQAFRSAAGVASVVIEEPTDPDLTEQQFSEVGGRVGGALLWFGERWGDQFPYSDDAILPAAPDEDVDSPAPCQTPIYNMQRLLTEIEYDWLRSLKHTTEEGSHDSVYKSGQVLVRDSIWSTRPLEWVWRLHLALTSGSPDDKIEFSGASITT